MTITLGVRNASTDWFAVTEAFALIDVSAVSEAFVVTYASALSDAFADCRVSLPSQAQAARGDPVAHVDIGLIDTRAEGQPLLSKVLSFLLPKILKKSASKAVQ